MTPKQMRIRALIAAIVLVAAFRTCSVLREEPGDSEGFRVFKPADQR